MADISFPSSNTVLQLLSEVRIEPGEVADALEAHSRAVNTMATLQFGVGHISLETAQQVAGEAVFDAAAIAARLGIRVEELQLELVRSSPKRRRLIAAVHESSHAAASFACGIPVTLCSIDPDDLAPGQEGVTRTTGDVEFLVNFEASSPLLTEDLRRTLEPRARCAAAICLAGPYGESSAFRSRFPAFWTDLSNARDLCGKFFAADIRDRVLLQSHHAAVRIVQVTRRGILALSRLLDEQGRLNGDAVDATLRERVKPERLRSLDDLFPSGT